MGLIDYILSGSVEKRVQAEVAQRELVIKSKIPDLVQEQVKSQISKQYGGSGFINLGVQRYSTDYNMDANSLRKKPNTNISFEILRRFSVSNEIVRAAINARKRQITQLEWDIVAVDSSDHTDYSSDIVRIQAFMKNIGGYKTRFRTLLDTLVEDLLVLDAVALYKQRNAKGELISLIPVDAATITLRVDEAGSTPIPPEIAYKQIIRGQIVAEMTTEELVYDMMNPRSNTPYGLPPIESLILIITSMLRGELANLNYLTDGNIPEGFFHVPDHWSPEAIREFQETFDAYMAGDPKATSKIKFVPEGTYQPTKKPEDMAWKEFNLWLMEVICAIFDIPPQELGFTTHQSTRANSQTQFDITMRRSLLPLANFVRDLMNDCIQDDLGMPHLQFKFLGLEDRDQLQEAQVQQIHVQTGVRTINEVRKDDLGLLPLADGDIPLISGITASLPNIINPPVTTASGVQQPSSSGGYTTTTPPTSSGQDDNGKGGARLTPGQDKPKPLNISDPAVPAQGKSVDYATTYEELRKMRDFAIKRLKDGKAVREFTSDILPVVTLTELNKQIAQCGTPFEVRTVFRDFMKSDQVEFLADLQNVSRDLKKILEAA